jgi:hypothetical protein
VRLTTSSCKEKCDEKFLRGKKFLEEAKDNLYGCGATDFDDDDDDEYRGQTDHFNSLVSLISKLGHA